MLLVDFSFFLIKHTTPPYGILQQPAIHIFRQTNKVHCKHFILVMLQDIAFFFRSTFEFICISLKNFIEKKNTHWRHSVPFRCRVAIALWRLGGGADYRSISEHFGLGKSTVHSVIYILCYNNTHFYVDYTLFAVAQQYLRYSCYF